MDWTDAKCSDLEPHVFFPTVKAKRSRGGSKPRNHALEQVQAEIGERICKGGDGAGRCPIISECLDWALTTRQEYGVWGGESEGSRERIRKRRRTNVA